MLKTNFFVSLLIGDQELYTKDKYNALYHESAVSFKSEHDVQSLYSMVQAFIDCDYVAFEQQSQLIMYNSIKPYDKLVEKVISHIKMTKLLQIIKPYTIVKLSYLSRRLNAKL
jgi:hypothetical protein